MPLYRKPHDAQIIYKVDTQDAALINIVKNAEMVTIQPQRFDIQKLINGEVMSVSVDVYTGHFERDGSLKQENIEITFKQQVYLRMLENLSPASLQKEYDRIAVSNGKSLLVNKIQSAPSFDHIVMLSDTNSCIKG